jgi:DNA-binding PadR family transcriptional regulator
MQTESYTGSLNGTMEQTSLAETVKRMKETCNECNPLSTVTCIAGCNIWKMKNEFRDLHKKIKDTDFMARLLNALKNTKRLQVLDTLSKNHTTMGKLQQELKKPDRCHSQETIVEEYVGPLIEVGLAAHDGDKYFATVLGRRLNEVMMQYPYFVEVLPPHSKGHEETALAAIFKQPKTHDSLERLIPPGNVARVLSRLQSTGLVTTTEENDYVFFFKTQRDPNKEGFSPTEKKVYENIPEEGVSARRLARKASISLRRIYKYLRRLKGKKLIFARERPKLYALTDEGVRLAIVLQCIQDLTGEVFEATAQVVNDGKAGEFVVTTHQTKS